MELQAFEVQICVKAETRGFEMAFLAKAPQAAVSVRFYELEQKRFRANQVGFKQVFDNLTVKHMVVLRNRFSLSPTLF